MISIHTLLAFSLASFLLIVLPGPSVLFTIGRSLEFGPRGGLVSAVGNGLGGIPPAIAVALGVGALVAESAVLFTVVKSVGAVYIAYLGWQAIKHRGDQALDVAGPAKAMSSGRILRQGFVVGITNPKILVFFVAVLPQFVDPANGNVALQMMLLGMIFVTIGVLSDGTWALVAGSARDWFAQSPSRISTMSAAGGAVMIGLGGVLLVTGDQH
ncbi:LysE family translocator [Ornithinimicrobium sp. INDO-MA30-4]|uniref:LysE family translocator n=1 Tax=Ornithinimicrobium sp. INDO-MA30-4 TaxID=2908651 RepID=UPI001F197C64|nr:LysE family translocator [Ornithinimicrobium sp. INDO-MA30-4]UJH71054.1 LysE family translocator [Ornithinimicrobium sp. INDO-MA30-4]